MKKISRIASVVTLLVLATAGPALAAPKADHLVPIKGTVLALENGQEAPVGCPPAAEAEWRFNSSGTGRMSHLGKTELDLTQCSRMTGPTTGASIGTTTFTAANGDELEIAQEATFAVIGAFDGFELIGTWDVIRGTGRFAHAEGSGSIHALGDIPSGVTVFDLPVGATLWNITGDIVYNSSGR